MNPVLSLLLAVLIYPGVLVALVAAWLLTWVRTSTRAALAGTAVPNPISEVSELRVDFGRETLAPDGVHPAVVTLATGVALLSPLLALIFLPVPENPIAVSIGLPGDLAVVGALLFGVPLARIFLGWAIPSASSRLAADRGARLLAGAFVPAILAITAAAQQVSTFVLLYEVVRTPLPFLSLLGRILAAAAFACVLPVLAYRSAPRKDDTAGDALSSEVAELTGQDLVYFRIGEAIQLVAVAGFFVAAFLLPIVRQLPAGGGRTLFWIVFTILTAAGIGIWEGVSGKIRRGEEQPPLSWWLGLPLLLSLAALVATAWATRG